MLLTHAADDLTALWYGCCRSSRWATVPLESGWLWAWRAATWRCFTTPSRTNTSFTCTKAASSRSSLPTAVCKDTRYVSTTSRPMSYRDDVHGFYDWGACVHITVGSNLSSGNSEEREEQRKYNRTQIKKSFWLVWGGLVGFIETFWTPETKILMKPSCLSLLEDCGLCLMMSSCCGFIIYWMYSSYSWSLLGFVILLELLLTKKTICRCWNDENSHWLLFSRLKAVSVNKNALYFCSGTFYIWDFCLSTEINDRFLCMSLF